METVKRAGFKIIVVTPEYHTDLDLDGLACMEGPFDRLAGRIRKNLARGKRNKDRWFLDEIPPLNTFLPPRYVKWRTRTNGGIFYKPIAGSIRQNIGGRTSTRMFQALCSDLDFSPDYDSLLATGECRSMPNKLYAGFLLILDKISGSLYEGHRPPKRFVFCNMFSELGTRPSFRTQLRRFLKTASEIIQFEKPCIESTSRCILYRRNGKPLEIPMEGKREERVYLQSSNRYIEIEKTGSQANLVEFMSLPSMGRMFGMQGEGSRVFPKPLLLSSYRWCQEEETSSYLLSVSSPKKIDSRTIGIHVKAGIPSNLGTLTATFPVHFQYSTPEEASRLSGKMCKSAVLILSGAARTFGDKFVSGFVDMLNRPFSDVYIFVFPGDNLRRLLDQISTFHGS